MANVTRLVNVGIVPEQAKELADQIDAGPGPVSSVNGATGVVVLDAGDVGALPDDTPIPSVDFATVSAIEGDWRGEGTETLLAALTALQSAI